MTTNSILSHIDHQSVMMDELDDLDETQVTVLNYFNCSKAKVDFFLVLWASLVSWDIISII